MRALLLAMLAACLCSGAQAQNETSGGCSPIVADNIAGGSITMFFDCSTSPGRPLIKSWRDEITTKNFLKFRDWIDNNGATSDGRRQILHIDAQIDAYEESGSSGTITLTEGDSPGLCAFQQEEAGHELDYVSHITIQCYGNPTRIRGYFLLERFDRVGFFSSWELTRVADEQVELRNPRFEVYVSEASVE